MTNPSVTDQVAEVVAKLESDKYPFDRDELTQAARLIATLAAEVEARRKQPLAPHTSEGTACPGCAIVYATAATDALLAEVKRG